MMPSESELNPFESLLEWFRTTFTDKKRFVTCAKNAAPKGSWPSETETDVVFFTAIVKALEAISRDHAVSVLRSWAREFPAHSGYLRKLADQFGQQLGAGIDLDAALDMCSLPGSPRPDETTTKQTPRQEDIKHEKGIADPSDKSIQHPKAVFTEKVERKDLFPQFLDFARERDIVFALGGVGSGLDTFTRQFLKDLSDSGVIVVNAVDFNTDSVRKINAAREAFEEARPEAESRAGANVHMELKCLMTDLAYATYNSLHDRFPEEMFNGLEGRRFPDPLVFSDYYYAESRKSKTNPEAMYGAAPEPILEYFFDSVQRFAVMTNVEEVVVFMGWPELAACFLDNVPSEDRKLGSVLWRALGDLVGNRSFRGPRTPYAQTTIPVPLNMRDRVCLVVCCSEVPYAHNSQQQKDLVARCVWPIPPLNKENVKYLVAKAMPDVEADPAADEIIDWTGGAPWFVKLLLSYVAYNKHLLDQYDGESRHLVAACGRAAASALEMGGNEIPDPIGRFIRDHRIKVQTALGARHPTDTTIEEKWAGHTDHRSEGYRIQPHRLEAFVASGLIWLKGNPWSTKQKDYVFDKYPTVFLDGACELPLALYRFVGDKDLRLETY